MLFFIALLALGTCHPLSPSGNYVFLGASDGNGTGTTVPCTYNDVHCIGGKAWPVQLVVHEPSLTLYDYGVVPFEGNGFTDGVRAEVDQMPANAQYITLGTFNELIRDALTGVPVATAVANYRSGVYDIIAAARKKAPGARVVFYNSPNWAAMGFMASQPQAVRELLQAIVNAVDVQVLNPLEKLTNATILDLRCDPNTYNPANLDAGGPHPNDAGAANLATLVLSGFSGPLPTPLADCPQAHLVP
jgi:hypothetical protein